MNTLVKTLGIIGHGNVGSHLCNVFSKHSSSLEVIVYNRSIVSDEKRMEGVKYTQCLNDMHGSELLVIAVKDDAINTVLEQLKGQISQNTIVSHSAGSVLSTVIQPYFKHYGVLYPLQTFSSDKEIDYSQIPVFITGSDDKTRKVLNSVARRISPKVKEIDDAQRMSLHIAAVFCSNYTNAMYTIGQKLCEDHHLDFDNLKPLIMETAQKVMVEAPELVQTGPAIRRDFEIIQKHERYLENYDKSIQMIYQNLADYIGQTT